MHRAYARPRLKRPKRSPDQPAENKQSVSSSARLASKLRLHSSERERNFSKLRIEYYPEPSS